MDSPSGTQSGVPGPPDPKPMPPIRLPHDVWYVRLADGRVLRAASTSVLRNQIVLGRIPLDIWVRRSPDDEWVTLQWRPEFADMVPPDEFTEAPRPPQTEAPAPAPRPPPAPRRDSMAARLDATELQTVGVRGLVEELLAAMDSALVPSKLLVASTAGVLCAAIAVIVESLRDTALLAGPWFPWALTGALVLFIGAVCTGLLTQLTYVELSSLRSARWSEAKAGLGRYGARFVLAYLLIAGSALAAIVAVRLGIWWLREHHGDWPAGRVLSVVDILLELILWPIPVIALLLGPILVVEDCSVLAALVQWWVLVRQHLGRIFLYQGLAATLGGIFTFAFALPLVLAAVGREPADFDPASATGATLGVLAGLVAGPLIAYTTVANVFIYLNLRYEVGTRRP